MTPKFFVDGQPVKEIDDSRPTITEWDEYPEVVHRVLPTKPWGDHVHPGPVIEPYTPPKDRGLFADPDLPNLLGQKGIERVDLTPSIGYIILHCLRPLKFRRRSNIENSTLLLGIQLSVLTDVQKDELALLVAHRGVVFFRNQDITSEEQRNLFDYYGW
jgi:sulfonate dioxygenase